MTLYQYAADHFIEFLRFLGGLLVVVAVCWWMARREV